MSTVDFIVKLQKGRKVRQSIQKYNKYLDVGAVFGSLTITKVSRRSQHGPLVYECECECGNSVSLSYHQLKNRGERNAGCLIPPCNHSEGQDKIRTDLEAAAKDQFRRLLIYMPDSTCEEWGGKGSLIDFNSAYHNFFEHLVDLGAREDSDKWWIYRIDNALDYEEGNIDLCSENRLKGSPGKRIFVYEQNILSVEEAAQILGCEEEEIITLQDLMLSDEEVYESLI